MAAETIVPPSLSPAAFGSGGGRLLMTMALLLMWATVIVEAWSEFRHGGGWPGSFFAFMTAGGFANLVSKPSVWAGTRAWARFFLKAFAAVLVLTALVSFVFLVGEIAQTASNSFHGERLQLLLYLPAGLAGMILAFIGIRRFEIRGGKIVLLLAAAWALMPFLFPVSLAMIAFLIAKREELLPELPVPA